MQIIANQCGRRFRIFEFNFLTSLLAFGEKGWPYKIEYCWIGLWYVPIDCHKNHLYIWHSLAAICDVNVGDNCEPPFGDGCRSGLEMAPLSSPVVNSYRLLK